jgi:hypothetical protein
VFKIIDSGDKLQMKQQNNELDKMKKYRKRLKPKPIGQVWITIICSGPPLNLIFRSMIEKDIKNPTVVIVLTVICMVISVASWVLYSKESKEFEKNWEKNSEEMITQAIQEDKAIVVIATIFNMLTMTAAASLVLFFLFLAIYLGCNLSFLKYIALTCIIIFLITLALLLIVGMVQMISLIRSLIKEIKSKK